MPTTDSKYYRIMRSPAEDWEPYCYIRSPGLPFRGAYDLRNPNEGDYIIEDPNGRVYVRYIEDNYPVSVKYLAIPSLNELLSNGTVVEAPKQIEELDYSLQRRLTSLTKELHRSEKVMKRLELDMQQKKFGFLTKAARTAQAYYAEEKDQFERYQQRYDELKTELQEKVIKPLEETQTCGYHLTWTLDNKGTLTISGHGFMRNCLHPPAPWKSVKNNIKNIIIKNGVENIGSNAFNGCTNLKTVFIPDSVEDIGVEAFGKCENLTAIEYPAHLKEDHYVKLIDLISSKHTEITALKNKLQLAKANNYNWGAQISLSENPDAWKLWKDYEAREKEISAMQNELDSLQAEVRQAIDGLDKIRPCSYEDATLVPADSLPEGWTWIQHNDGSGHLKSPDGKSYFSYNLLVCDGVDYREKSGEWSKEFGGSFAEFKAKAESIVNAKYLHIPVAIESTADYSNVKFHQELIDTEMQNEDGSYGKVVDYYRIAVIGEDGRIIPFDERVFSSAEDAQAAVKDDPALKLIPYDQLVHKAGNHLGFEFQSPQEDPEAIRRAAENFICGNSYSHETELVCPGD